MDILKELKDYEQSCSNNQKAFARKMIKDAKAVKCVPASEVLSDFVIEFIKRSLKPRARECYKNAHLLTAVFPEIEYVEGKLASPLCMDHAFNKFNDKYIDITLEFAINDDVTLYDYISLGEFKAEEISVISQKTGVYGGCYAYKKGLY